MTLLRLGLDRLGSSRGKRSLRWSPAVAVALLVPLLHAVPAVAEKATDKPADKGAGALLLLDQGIELFKAGRLEEARTAFVKVRQIVPDKANPYRWLGLVEARLGHCKEAVEALEIFIQRVPGNDARTIEAVTVRDRCKDELVVKVGTLVVDSTPPGAEVRIDGESGPSLGTTPFRSSEVVVGAHVATMKLPGFQPVSKVFTLGRGETVRLDVVMVAESALAQPSMPVGGGGTPEPARKSKYWLIGVGAGAVGAAVLGVGLGLGLRQDVASEPVFPSVPAF